MQFSRLIINSLLIFSTSVSNTVQIKLISRETDTFCNNCNDYALCMVIKADKAVNFGDGEGMQVHVS